MRFTVRMANMNIAIDSVHDKLQKFCRDYCVPECEPDFSIQIKPEDIEAERTEENEYRFKPEYLETVALHRKMAEKFLDYNRVLLHGAVFTYDNKGAFLFTAPSGTGKTTHIRQWKTFFGDKVKIVNGDKPFLEVRENGIQVYGSPWAGKEGWHKNRDAELKGICYIKRGTECSVRRLEPSEILNWLLSQIYFPPSKMLQTLDYVERILEFVPVYELTCDISEEAVKQSFEALTGLEYKKNAIKQEGKKDEN